MSPKRKAEDRTPVEAAPSGKRAKAAAFTPVNHPSHMKVLYMATIITHQDGVYPTNGHRWLQIEHSPDDDDDDDG